LVHSLFFGRLKNTRDTLHPRSAQARTDSAMIAAKPTLRGKINVPSQTAWR
jgi:hypothetical protein